MNWTLVAAGAVSSISLAAALFTLWRTERKLRAMELVIGQARKHQAESERDRDEAHRDADTHRRGAELARSQLHREQEVTRELRRELIRAREQARKELAARADRALADAASGDPRPAGDLLRDVLYADGDPDQDGNGASGAAASPGQPTPGGTSEAGGSRGSGG